ncbi:MAG: hypothetical protein JRJ45_10805 [Deltaproteobacteria bacterium]|nr:hypothetical protein [Deltaproteobacteria bacterium]
MSIVKGVFSETTLVNIQVKADSIWMDRIQREDYVPEAQVVNCIIDQTTAKFGALKGKKDPTVDVGWINACEVSAASCTDCTISGTELSTNVEEYYLNREQCAEFSVCENDFRDNFFDMEDVIAKGFLKASLALDEWWAGQVVAVLNANVGVNEITTGKGAVAGTTTYVLPAYWNADLFGYFARVAIGNRIKRPMLISGANLFESKFIADFEACCENKKGKFGSMDVCFDLFNIDSTNSPDLVTYMINRGALAFVTKAYYEGISAASPSKYMDQNRWSMPSFSLPGVIYDVHYDNECSGCGDFFTHNFKLKTFGDIFLNPVGCTATRTGVLEFECGEEP